MGLSRTLTKLICRALVGVFLFAQLAVASYACPGLAQALHAVEMQAETMPAGCDQIDQKAANLCLEHCRAGQQSSDTAPAPVVMAPALSLLYVLSDDDRQAAEAASAAAPSGDPLLAATPPPHAILHCVLRI